MKEIQEILLRLLEDLEAVGAEHEEIYDTEVREAMGSTVFRGLLKPDGEDAPIDYLDDETANQRVAEALKNYIDTANERAPQLGIVKFKDRLAAFQDCSVMTANERNTTDDFFGAYAPSAYDDDGRFIADEN